MTEVSLSLLVIVLVVNGLNFPVKREKLADELKSMIKLYTDYKRRMLESDTNRK